jgi:hypothetical protein
VSRTLSTISVDWLKIRDTLGRQQTLDPIHVPHTLGHQRSAFARQPPLVLLRRARRPHHRANSPFAAGPGHQRAQQHLDIEPIRIGPAVTPVHGNRSGINHVTFHTVRFQQPMHPEPVKPSLID